MAKGATSDERANSLENVTKTIGNLLDGYDIRLRPNFGGENSSFHSRSKVFITWDTLFIFAMLLGANTVFSPYLRLAK